MYTNLSFDSPPSDSLRLWNVSWPSVVNSANVNIITAPLFSIAVVWVKFDIPFPKYTRWYWSRPRHLGCLPRSLTRSSMMVTLSAPVIRKNVSMEYLYMPWRRVCIMSTGVHPWIPCRSPPKSIRWKAFLIKCWDISFRSSSVSAMRASTSACNIHLHTQSGLFDSQPGQSQARLMRATCIP